MRAIPRHRFVAEALAAKAYSDNALPIGEKQTISQPWVVARMTELAEVGPDDRVLEIGTGSGYQAAVLSRLARHVYSVERIPSLARRARRSSRDLGDQQRLGEGLRRHLRLGRMGAVPVIVVTAAAARRPARSSTSSPRADVS